jgi:SAUR family protein
VPPTPAAFFFLCSHQIVQLLLPLFPLSRLHRAAGYLPRGAGSLPTQPPRAAWATPLRRRLPPLRRRPPPSRPCAAGLRVLLRLPGSRRAPSLPASPPPPDRGRPAGSRCAPSPPVSPPTAAALCRIPLRPASPRQDPTILCPIANFRDLLLQLSSACAATDHLDDDDVAALCYYC